jgi:hypothetical protein
VISPRAGEKVSSMPRRCTVYDHPKRHSIDEALVIGAPYRSVAKRFELSESSVYRHKTEHLPAHLLKGRKIEEVAQADELLEQVRTLQGHALGILERAEKAGDLRTALAAISQTRGNLELLGKLAETGRAWPPRTDGYGAACGTGRRRRWLSPLWTTCYTNTGETSVT